MKDDQKKVSSQFKEAVESLKAFAKEIEAYEKEPLNANKYKNWAKIANSCRAISLKVKAIKSLMN